MNKQFSEFIEQNRRQIILSLLALLVIAVYWQATGFEFINFDDNIYVYNNPNVTRGLSLSSIYWAFTEFHSANWHPLTWISHQLDVSLFGLRSGSHHATNIVFHLINTILTFAVFRRFTGCFWKSAIVAALFAIHPAHVESVAWVSERKDVLSTMFWLLTMWAYIGYAEKAKSGSVNYVSMLPVILLMALGLMAKPMLVTLPFVLILMDFWTFERLTSLRDLPRLLIEKVPLFLLAAASSVITIFAQRSGGAVQSLELLPFGTRVLNAGVAYVKYIVMLFYPVDLAVWYPYETNIPAFRFAGALVILAAITAVCIWQIKKRKYLLMGWLWFLGTLVPVIGLMQVGMQSLADRYTYIPFFGLFIMLVWGVHDLLRSFDLGKKIAPAIGAPVIIVLTVICFHQVSLWRTNESVYSHGIAVTKDNYLFMQNYCHSLTMENRLDEAEKQCRDSIAINPKYGEAHNSLGIIQLKRGNYADAAESFKRAIEYNPRLVLMRVNLAIALSRLGSPEEAEEQLKTAASVSGLAENRDIFLNSINDLAHSYARQNKIEKASEHFSRALSIAPERADIRSNLALTLFTSGKIEDAQKQIEAAISRNPNSAESFNIYGLILSKQKKNDLAAAQFERALQLNPDYKDAAENLSKLKEEVNKK